MSVKCKICGNDFEDSSDDIIMCKHHKGAVHFGCCINNCSKEFKPCVHAIAQYVKRDKFQEAW